MTSGIECVVIGAGIIGLAIARALAVSGREVIVLESEAAIGTATSSRNSEVIHAGLYYPPGSVKSRLCVAGKHALYEYCAERGIPHKRLGKLIVATDASEVAALEDIRNNARRNGVDDLEHLERQALGRLEPSVRGEAALLSPSTGIVDSHALMLSYQGEMEDNGGRVALHSRLIGAQARRGGFDLDIALDGGERMRLSCGVLVNAAGLEAQTVAHSIAGLGAEAIPPRYLAKGIYFALSGGSPFQHLIYPVPRETGLGIHATPDMGGSTRFGPDVEWVEEVDYAVDPGRAAAFVERIRRYYPGLPDGALDPAYAGVRPRIVAPGEAPGDFVIQGPGEHGVDGLVSLFGIESPGLTASLAIADAVLAAL